MHWATGQLLLSPWGLKGKWKRIVTPTQRRPSYRNVLLRLTTSDTPILRQSYREGTTGIYSDLPFLPSSHLLLKPDWKMEGMGANCWPYRAGSWIDQSGEKILGKTRDILQTQIRCPASKRSWSSRGKRSKQIWTAWLGLRSRSGRHSQQWSTQDMTSDSGGELEKIYGRHSSILNDQMLFWWEN